MKINELRQALESHYLSEGHSLLSADGSFPYSDKDIELVCGSLVTVRNGTLQVVHLTVKQYMKSQSGPKALCLSAGTEGASLQLTLACLGFLKRECAEPIADLSPKRRIGAEELELDPSLLRSKKPFLEYACFSWLAHMIDCKRIDALEVSTSLYRTFDSPSTFGWIESCMVLQPFSGPRLLLGLEDARDWINDSQIDGTLAVDSSLSFVSNWCATMEQVLEEYSEVIQMQTAEIYYLDLASAFAAHGLMDTYEKHGGLIRRQRCSHFPTDRIPRLARKKVPPRRQLHTKYGTLGLYIYEPNRDIFIWSYEFLCPGQDFLYAQSASSGRQLSPVNDPQIYPSVHGGIFFHSYAISKDGSHLAVVYQNYWQFLLVSIWEIQLTLDFTRRTQASSWARIIYISTLYGLSIRSGWRHPCVAFNQDGVCCTPNGLVRTASRGISFIPNSSLQRLLVEDTQHDLEPQSAIYSENGKFLFIFSKTIITKYSVPSLDVCFQQSLSQMKSQGSMASPSGRYVALFAHHQASDPAKPKYSTLLVDTESGNTVVLPDSTGQVKMGKPFLLHFSVDESEVVACYLDDFAGSYHLCIRYYTGFLNEVRLKASGSCVGDVGRITRLYVSSDHRTAYPVAGSGEVQRIKFGDEIEFLDAPDTANEYLSRLNFLSRDGSRWASVYDCSDKTQINIHTVLNRDERPRCIELQRKSSLRDSRHSFVTMSMDLSILVLDGDIHMVGDSRLGELPIVSHTLELPRELIFGESAGETRPLACLVDPSNSYVAYLKQNRCQGGGPTCSDILALFRINADETSSPPLQLLLREDMSDISSNFHPSLPLLIVGFRLISEAGALDHILREQYRERIHAPIPYHVVVIDMSTMSKCAVEIDQSLGFDMIEM